MENQNVSNKPNPQPPMEKKTIPAFLIALIVILVIGIGVVAYMYYQKSQNLVAIENQLTSEKDSLSYELKDLMVSYDSLKTDNDSMNLKLEIEQEKIRKLLGIQRSNYEKIRLYRKELNTLREIMKSYIIQIDSLSLKNQELMTENKEVRTQLEDAHKSNVELSQVKQDLTSKVEMASVLSAKNVEAIGLNSRSKEKDKWDKVVKLRICFTLRENPIVPAGTKNVFIKIVRPDEITLTSPDNLYIEIAEEQVAMTAMRQVEYDNQDIEMCIFWDNNGELIAGTYNVFLYAEKNVIGNTSFTLK